MRKLRTFTSQFKREVVEELLNRTTEPAQLARRYNLSSGLLYHWKNQYARGKLNNEPTEEAALWNRISQLEQMLGKLTLENEFLKRLCRAPSRNREKREFIHLHQGLIPSIQRGCELMKISRSTFYYRGKEKSFEQLKAETDLRDRIEKICLN